MSYTNNWDYDYSWGLYCPYGPYLYIESKDYTLDNLFNNYELNILNLNKELKRVPLYIDEQTNNKIVSRPYPLALLDIKHKIFKESFSLGFIVKCSYKIENNKYKLNNFIFDFYTKHISNHEWSEYKNHTESVRYKKYPNHYMYQHYNTCDYYGACVEGVVYLSEKERYKCYEKYDKYIENKRNNKENIIHKDIVSVCNLSVDSNIFCNYMKKRFQEKTGEDVETYCNKKINILKNYFENKLNNK